MLCAARPAQSLSPALSSRPARPLLGLSRLQARAGRGWSGRWPRGVAVCALMGARPRRARAGSGDAGCGHVVCDGVGRWYACMRVSPGGVGTGPYPMPPPRPAGRPNGRRALRGGARAVSSPVGPDVQCWGLRAGVGHLLAGPHPPVRPRRALHTVHAADDGRQPPRLPMPPAPPPRRHGPARHIAPAPVPPPSFLQAGRAGRCGWAGRMGP